MYVYIFITGTGKSHVVQLIKRDMTYFLKNILNADPDQPIVLMTAPMADPEFPIRGHAPIGGGGCGPLMWALFSENVCENERIESHRGHVLGMPPLYWFSSIPDWWINHRISTTDL